MALAERGRGRARGAAAVLGLGLDRPLIIGSEMPHAAIRLGHFDIPEEDFAWSMGRFAEVRFAATPPADRTLLLLEIDVFRAPPVLTGQNVLTYLNGLRMHSAYVTARTTLRIPLRPGILTEDDNVLTFDLPDAIRPIEFGMEDGRMLGVKLFSLTLETEA